MSKKSRRNNQQNPNATPDSVQQPLEQQQETIEQPTQVQQEPAEDIPAVPDQTAQQPAQEPPSQQEPPEDVPASDLLPPETMPTQALPIGDASGQPPQQPPLPPAASQPPVEPKKTPVRIVLILLLVAALVAAGILFLLPQIAKVPIDQPVENVSITVDSSKFVEDGTVVLDGLGGFSKEYLEEKMYFVPQANFTATKKGGQFVVQFEQYENISYLGYFPYQTPEKQDKVEIFNVNGMNLTVRILNDNVFANSSVQLKFSEPIDINSLKQHLKISPEIDYTLRYDLDVASIRPTGENGWDISEPYTITIDEGYTSTTGKKLAKTQTLQFDLVRYDDDGNIVRYFPEIKFHNDDSFIITKDVDMALSFTGTLLTGETPVTIDTYYLGDVEKFKNQGKIFLQNDVNLDTLEKVDTNGFEIVDGNNRFQVKTPGLGAYILSIKYHDPNNPENTIEKRTAYLVTPYSMYLQSSRSETLAWLHNGDEAGPAKGYTVEFGEDANRRVVTDDHGLAIAENVPTTLPDNPNNSENSYSYYSRYQPVETTRVSIYDPNGKLVYYDDADLRTKSEDRTDSFYSYLFLDRSIYRPTDTIQFWGFVKPFRTNELPMPKFATAVFDADGLNIRVKCEIDKDGVFRGDIPLDQIRSSDYTVSTIFEYPADPLVEGSKDRELTLNNEYLSVKDFQKPNYLIKTKTDQEFYRGGETVTVTATPTFYDGTPLPNFKLEVYTRNGAWGEWVRLDDITTDANGTASFSFPVPEKSNDYDNSISVDFQYYRVQISSDGEQITSVNSYPCFYPTVVVEQLFQKQADGKNLEATINTYEIDLDKPEFKKFMQDNAENYWKIFSQETILATAKGKPVDMKVDLALRWKFEDTDGVVHKNSHRAQREGYYEFDNWYGFDYRYVPAEDLEIVSSWETEEKNIEVNTKDGTATISNLIFLDKTTTIDFSKNYYLRSIAKYKDGDYDYEDYEYYPENASYYSWRYTEATDSKPTGFTYQITDTVSGDDLTPDSDYYRSATLNLGQPTRFELLLDGEKVDRKGTILYSTIQNGLYEYKTVDANEFLFEYRTDYGPDVQLLAAYFDGERVHYISDLYLSVSEESMALNIEVTPDKDSYRPGDSVTLKVKTTNASGKGDSSNLCVAIVDEAVFAVSERYLNVYDDLYQDFWDFDNFVTKYCTTYRAGGANSNVWAGGKGDGDGGAFYDSFRKNFKDTASFIPVHTDSDGNATVTFDLPDNVTSWRITTVAIGDDLRAGSGKTNIISTMPFFTKPVVSGKYIDGDEVSFLVQGFGVVLEEDSEIDYAVTLKGDGYEKTLTTKGKAAQPWEFNFGILPIGSYTLSAKSSFEGYSDTVELPVDVIKSNLELVVNTPIKVELDVPLDINALRYPVSLTVYDKNNKPYYDSISSLFGHYCMMPSQRMSRFVAKRTIRNTLGEDADIPYYIAKGNDSVADMQQGDGGIGPYKNTPSELMLSVYMSLIAPDQFDQEMLATYFNSQLETINQTGNSVPNREKQRAAAYMGLAALGRVDAQEIYAYLGRNKDGEIKKEVTLRLDEKAYYVAALAYLGETDNAKKIYDSDLKPHIAGIANREIVPFYRMYNELDLNWERDTSAIWIAASKLDAADADQIAEYYSKHVWRYQSLFECMIYVLNYQLKTNDLEFAYTVDGKSTTQKTGVLGAYTVVLNKTDLQSLRFTKLPDDLVVNAYYVGEPTELGMQPSDEISITKEAVTVGENTHEITLTLTFTDDAPEGVYDISDWIPSNSRLYNVDDSNNNDKYYLRSEGQKIYTSYYREKGVKTAVIKYQIRQTYHAVAVMDTVYVIHGETGVNTTAQKGLFAPKNFVLDLPMIHVDASKNIAPGAKTEETADKTGGEEEPAETSEQSKTP